MFGSSSGEPYWHQATASLPSKTRAACAWPSRTRRSFQGRPFSPSGLPSREWNHVHQQPPNPAPLCLSSKRAYASHVEASSALTSYSLIAAPLTEIARLTSEESTCLLRLGRRLLSYEPDDEHLVRSGPLLPTRRSTGASREVSPDLRWQDRPYVVGREAARPRRRRIELHLAVRPPPAVAPGDTAIWMGQASGSSP